MRHLYCHKTCSHTGGQTDKRTGYIRLVIKNIYTFWSLP